MTKERIIIGSLITYPFAIFPNKVYRYIGDMKNGIAICEDKEGNKWRFSRTELVQATEEQKNEFYNIKQP